MRLIDADKLIEKLRDFKEWENDDGRPIHTMSETQRIDRCINFAQTEPIAFDVDKVIGQLEKKIQTHECCMEYEKKNGTITEEFQQRKAVEVLKDAIEIVKAGGKEQ